MTRIFSIILFIIYVHYLGRILSPILIRKLKETSKTEEKGENEEKTYIEIEKTSKTKGIKQERERSIEEYSSLSLFRKKRRIQTKLMKHKRSK